MFTALIVCSNADGTPSMIGVGDVADVWNPLLTTDDSGHAIALWHVALGNYVVYTARLDTSWGAAMMLDTMPEGPASILSPCLAGNRIGSASVIWGYNTGPSTYRFAASSWSGPTMLPLAPAVSQPSAANPDIAMSGNDAMAVWVQSDSAAVGVFANRYVFPTGWGSAARLDTTGVTSGNSPKVATSPYGTSAVALWSLAGNPTTGLWANRFGPSAGWGGAVKLSDKGDIGGGRNLRVTMDNSGNVLAIWPQADGSSTGIWAIRFDAATSTWGSAVNIQSTTTGDASTPELAMEPGGVAMAVWTQTAGQHQDIWANRYAPAIGWGIAVKIETDDSGDAVRPRIAIEASGNAIAVWQQSDSTRYNILANHFD